MNVRPITKLNFMVLLSLIIFQSVGNTQQMEKTALLQNVADIFLGTWEGEGNAPEGEKFQSELRFKWTLNKNFIEVENIIRSGDGNGNGLFALTLYGWQPVLKQVVFWSFDRDGTINEGVAKLQGNSLNHEWRSFSQNGEIKDWRSTLTKHDSKSISFTITDVQAGESFSVHYKRKK